MANQVTRSFSPKVDTRFDLSTGLIKPNFQRQIEVVGIVVKQHFSEYQQYHIKNVNAELQVNGCFQKDFDLYKNGGTSEFHISNEQAIAFLDDEYSKRTATLPETRGELVDGVICSGIFTDSVKPTLHKRFLGLKESLQNGDRYRNVYVICKNEQIKDIAKEYVQENLKNAFENISFVYVVSNVETDIGMHGLKKIESEEHPLKKYVVISDPTSMGKDYQIATTTLSQEFECLGVAASPVKDWSLAMNDYGYEKSLGSKEKATIAWARAEWNFIARQVNAELRSYEASHLNK